MASPAVSDSKAAKGFRKDIQTFIGNEDVESAITALREGLKATKTSRERDPKRPRGINYVDKADHTVRFHAAKLLLEYGFGKPATRAEISISDNTSQAASPTEILKRIQNSATSFREITEAYVESLPEVGVEEAGKPLNLENEE
jgi:hypothetical protein